MRSDLLQNALDVVGHGWSVLDAVADDEEKLAKKKLEGMLLLAIFGCASDQAARKCGVGLAQ